LLQTPVFCDLGPDEVAELLPYLRERQFARGETGWLEGARSGELYIVVGGAGRCRDHSLRRGLE
jgi:hypothetical protein